MMSFSPRARKALVAGVVVMTGFTAARASDAGGSKPSLADGGQVVVKLADDPAITVAAIADAFGLRVVKDVLASRRIYLLESIVAPTGKGQRSRTGKGLASELGKDGRIEWAEENQAIDASDDRFHAWPEGDPTYVGTDSAVWLKQPAAKQLFLDDVHRQTTGSGITVAVLDTGVDRRHPALAGRLGRAWDYVDDDNDPTDRRDGKDNDNDGLTDEAFGHGTHIAGIVALVAPDATILPSRVLDADGRGNVFLVAQAIADVVEDGADVINLSFGTEDNTDSKLLKDAISHAQHQGIVVVASAGNNGSTARRFPASAHNVIAVAGAGAAATGLASFSNRGTWVRVAAPSTDIVSAIPGGGYAAWSGTSMAAPFVSGEAALIKQSSRKSDPKTVLDAIFGSLTKFRTGQKDDPGLVDLVASLRRTR